MISQDFLKAIATEYSVSEGELEVLSLAMQGQSTADIAKRIGISGDAVRKRLSEVYQKFEIAGRGPVKLTKLQQLLISRYQEHQSKIATDSTLKRRQAKTNQVHQRQDWGEAPDISVFYGRTEELATLESWIVQESCRLVALLGIGGIGKTAISVRFAKQLKGEFENVFWRSLRQAPLVEDILAALIKFVCPEMTLPDTVDGQISWLIEYFREHRTMVILDGAESILQSGNLAGVYREGYEGYGELIRRLAEEPHQSCLLLTSREKLSEISLLEGETLPVRSLQLQGLGEAARLILKEKGLSGQKNWGELIRGYRGNPFMLKLVATTIKEVFDGNVTDFLKTTLFTNDVNDYIEEMLDRLTDLEEKVIYQIANKKATVNLEELQGIFPEISPQALIRALASLRQRSLVEKSEGGFTLPPAVTEVANQLVVSEQ
ncbi:MAG: NACHT domain-containing protein [Coleofasciculaceae cyanobacterium]